MFDSLRKHWRDFKESRPGRRFQDVHDRRAAERGAGEGGGGGYIGLVAGVILTVVGIVFLPAPGPGSVVLFLGLAMLARESRVVARMLDKAELKCRPAFLWARDKWNSISSGNRKLIVAAASVVGLAAAAFFYFKVMR